MRTASKILTAMIAAIVAFPFMFLSPASADDGARIHLIHGIPDVDVDVEAGGENVFEGFSFGDTQDLSALAGATLEDLKVKAAGTDTVAIDAGDIELPATGNYTVIAHLDADGTPTLGIFQNDVATIAAGEGRLTVRHTAAAPAVDILANGAAAFSNVENGNGGTVDLGVGTISAEVVPTGTTSPVVIGPADLPIKDGEHLLVYAVGSLDGESLTVLTETITDLHSTPNQVHTGNSLPASDSIIAGSTLVLLAGAAMLSLGGFGAVAVRRVRA
ncbi:MAG: DUF4397 domain-containing protein [Acidimicrobiales bacterium]